MPETAALRALRQHIRDKEVDTVIPFQTNGHLSILGSAFKAHERDQPPPSWASLAVDATRDLLLLPKPARGFLFVSAFLAQQRGEAWTRESLLEGLERLLLAVGVEEYVSEVVARASVQYPLDEQIALLELVMRLANGEEVADAPACLVRLIDRDPAAALSVLYG